MPAENLPRRFWSVLAIALPLTACGSTPDEPESEPYVPPEEQAEPSVGYYLTDLDNQLRAWTNLKLDASTNRERRVLRGLERELTQVTARRQDDLLAQLDSSFPRNRAVAAVALGFTGDDAVVSPLLNALSDPDPGVVNNALVGLGVLGSPDTPLARLCYILNTDPDPWTRNNAAYAMQSVIYASVADRGEPPADDCARESCRDALIDNEPGVRAQAAGVLGILVDEQSVQSLGDMLYDEVPLVSKAAAASLANIGLKRMESKGSVARLLVEALERVDPKHRDYILAQMRHIAADDYGDDTDLWVEWAYRLP